MIDFLSSINTKCVKATVLSGTTVCGVNICTTSSFSSPIVCGNSCVVSPLISGNTICSTACIISPELQLTSISAKTSETAIAYLTSDGCIVSGTSSYTFNNGLTENIGIVKLGGTLTENTVISGGSAYSFDVYGKNVMICAEDEIIALYNTVTAFELNNSGFIVNTDGEIILGSTSGIVNIPNLSGKTTETKQLYINDSGYVVSGTSSGGETNLGTTYTTTNITITSDTGTNATLIGATATSAGIITTGNQLFAGAKCSSIWCGTSCVRAPAICGTSCVVGNCVLGTTCVYSAYVCATTALNAQSINVLNGHISLYNCYPLILDNDYDSFARIESDNTGSLYSYGACTFILSSAGGNFIFRNGDGGGKHDIEYQNSCQTGFAKIGTNIILTTGATRYICFDTASTGTGSVLCIAGNQGAATSAGGSVVIYGGLGGSTSGNGGSTYLAGGSSNGSSGNGGNAYLSGGFSNAGNGGQVVITGGYGETSSGNVSITGGENASSTIKAGCVFIQGGYNDDTGTGGDVIICGGNNIDGNYCAGDIKNFAKNICLFDSDAITGIIIKKTGITTTLGGDNKIQVLVDGGVCFYGKLCLSIGTTARASLAIPHGTAPTSPINGDMWTTTSGVFARVNGTTKQLDGDGSTNLGTSYNTTNITITSDTGTDAVLTGATPSSAGIVTTGNQLFDGIKCAPTWCGITCMRTSAFCATTAVRTSIVCASTCVCSPIITGGTIVRAPIVCGVNGVFSDNFVFSNTSPSNICFISASGSGGKHLNIIGNQGAATSCGGDICLIGGRGGTTSGNGGCVVIAGGDKTSGVDGQIYTKNKLNLTSTLSDAPLNLSVVSSVPTTLVNSDIWATNDGFYARISGATQTIVTKKTVSIASDTTPNPTGDGKENEYFLTALAGNASFQAPSGTAVNGNTLLIRIKDNGTSRNLLWNLIYRAIGVTLPTATTANKTIYVGAIYNSTDSKWDVVSVAEEA